MSLWLRSSAFFFFKQKTAYEMRISDWSSDVCSSDLVIPNELLSLMLDVGGKVIADAEPDETDLDDLARAAVDVLQKYVAARHPESPGGVRIVHSETDDIKMSARALGDRAG